MGSNVSHRCLLDASSQQQALRVAVWYTTLQTMDYRNARLKKGSQNEEQCAGRAAFVTVVEGGEMVFNYSRASFLTKITATPKTTAVGGYPPPVSLIRSMYVGVLVQQLGEHLVL